jgi:hypothetical protein
MSDNLVIDVLIALPKLVNEGIRLLREGESNRKKFFEVCVGPIQNALDRLYEAHGATFQAAHKAAESEDFDQLRKVVETAVRFEQGNTDRLAIAVSSARDIRVRGQLGRLFKEYVDTVALLIIPPRKNDLRARITAYSTLENILFRECGSRELDTLIRNFDRYYVSTRQAYEKLRLYCLR